MRLFSMIEVSVYILYFPIKDLMVSSQVFLCKNCGIFSSTGRSPGRAIVLHPASALASARALAKC